MRLNCLNGFEAGGPPVGQCPDTLTYSFFHTAQTALLAVVQVQCCPLCSTLCAAAPGTVQHSSTAHPGPDMPAERGARGRREGPLSERRCGEEVLARCRDAARVLLCTSGVPPALKSGVPRCVSHNRTPTNARAEVRPNPPPEGQR